MQQNSREFQRLNGRFARFFSEAQVLDSADLPNLEAEFRVACRESHFADLIGGFLSPEGISRLPESGQRKRLLRHRVDVAGAWGGTAILGCVL
jgi:hypothetical protein